MKIMLIILPLMVAYAAVPGQIDVVCRAYCSALAIQNGVVRFTEDSSRGPIRSFVVGRYLRTVQGLVPKTEAPIRDLRTPKGWRIVVSAFLDYSELTVKVRLRWFEPDGKLSLTDEALAVLEQDKIGRLFGGSDEVFAITSTEEHAYNVQTEIWFLPARGKPKSVLYIQGVFRNFSTGKGGMPPGVAIDRQTYDGVSAETKGIVKEFYAWDREAKSLTLRGK